MRGKIIISRFWTAIFSGGKARAVTIFPFIFLLRKTYKDEEDLINHERIHLMQALELLVIPFYIWYCLEFFIRFLQYKDARSAYLNISFEREAYRNENNLAYRKNRKFWAFWPYLLK